MRATGRLRYAIVESDLPAVLQDISEYISTSQNTVFNADWALLAEWMNVCPFNNSLCLNVDVSCHIHTIVLFSLHFSLIHFK